MTKKSSKLKTGYQGDGDRFVALPWQVLTCPAYVGLGHVARSLLVEIAMQFVRNNNGTLLCSHSHLSKRGWTSNSTITRAKGELLEAGFIFQTVRGHRPNKASWFAVTWHSLDNHKGFDPGALMGFSRGSYRNQGNKNASLTPSEGAKGNLIAPSRGVERVLPTPSGGAIRAPLGVSPTPSEGDHLVTIYTTQSTHH